MTQIDYVKIFKNLLSSERAYKKAGVNPAINKLILVKHLHSWPQPSKYSCCKESINKSIKHRFEGNSPTSFIPDTVL